MTIKVLLVDDEKDFINSLKQRLELRGFDVKTAYTGEEALDIVKNGNLDVIVLDVLMPGKSGIDTLREIKVETPLIEVIMLTGHATVETAIKGMKLGAYDFLMKPIEADELIGKIKKAHALKSDHEKRIRKAEVNGILKRKGW
ncbi:MAG: response regulator [Desulfobacteraceae bacterium]|nr:response regulator [Desulfobacteraceae bacterium]